MGDWADKIANEILGVNRYYQEYPPLVAQALREAVAGERAAILAHVLDVRKTCVDTVDRLGAIGVDASAYALVRDTLGEIAVEIGARSNP